MEDSILWTFNSALCQKKKILHQASFCLFVCFIFLWDSTCQHLAESRSRVHSIMQIKEKKEERERKAGRKGEKETGRGERRREGKTGGNHWRVRCLHLYAITMGIWCVTISHTRASLVAQMVNNLTGAIQEDLRLDPWVRKIPWKGNGTPFSILPGEF